MEDNGSGASRKEKKKKEKMREKIQLSGKMEIFKCIIQKMGYRLCDPFQKWILHLTSTNHTFYHPKEN